MALPAPPSPSLFAKTYRRVKRHRPEPPAVQAASAPAPAEHSDEPSPAAGKAEPPPPPLVDLSALVRSKIAYYAEVDRTVLETMCLDEPPLGAQFAAEAEPDTGEDVLDAGDADGGEVSGDESSDLEPLVHPELGEGAPPVLQGVYSSLRSSDQVFERCCFDVAGFLCAMHGRLSEDAVAGLRGEILAGGSTQVGKSMFVVVGVLLAKARHRLPDSCLVPLSPTHPPRTP